MVAGMRVPQWFVLGGTVLLLVCQVIISQLCKSLIVLVDGFHTLFIIMNMTQSPPQGVIKPPLSSPDSPASPTHDSSSSEVPPSESSVKSIPSTKATTDGSAVPDQPDAPQPEISPAALSCGMSYTNCRSQVMEAFMTVFTLATLCLTYTIEIFIFFMDPEPVKRPELLVVVSAASLLFKILVLWLDWDQQQTMETESHLDLNRKVLAEEEAKGQVEPGQVLRDVSQVQPAVNDSVHNGALVLCNPGTPSIPDTDSQTPEPPSEVHPRAEAPQDSEVASNVASLHHSADITDTSKDKNDIGHVENQKSSNTSQECNSSHHSWGAVPTSQRSVYFPLLFLIIQGLSAAVMALINSLVMLLIGSHCMYTSEACSLLVYLDPSFSLLAVIILTATVVAPVHRYGLLLLQATPPHIRVSDLEQRIVNVPGVQAVHDLHVWQLTELLTVATVHVHCRPDFPADRCADLMSRVTKVLQSVGVTCCTVQPEFVSCSGSSKGDGGGAFPVVHSEDSSLHPLLSCSLACGKACTESLCCTPIEEETRPPAPSAAETKKEPQTLVIENSFP